MTNSSAVILHIMLTETKTAEKAMEKHFTTHLTELQIDSIEAAAHSPMCKVKSIKSLVCASSPCYLLFPPDVVTLN